MEYKFNVTGTDRKRLAAAISEFTGVKAEYQFMLTCAYVIGEFTLSKEGTLSCKDGRKRSSATFLARSSRTDIVSSILPTSKSRRSKANPNSPPLLLFC